LNKENRPLLTTIPTIKHLSNTELFTATEKGIKIIDTRNKTEFTEGFIPGSINIQNNNSFATWAGWLLSYEAPFILVAKQGHVEELTRKLMRIGLDNIYGFISDVQDWEMGGGTLEKGVNIDFQAFSDALKSNNLEVVDLRGASEFNSGHIPGAQNIFVGTLESNLDKISKNKNVVIHCQGGDRAAIGFSLLRRNGFSNIQNYSGGINEWIAQGNELELN
jgi:hydroxyacylglutathione hydrolase